MITSYVKVSNRIYHRFLCEGPFTGKISSLDCQVPNRLRSAHLFGPYTGKISSLDCQAPKQAPTRARSAHLIVRPHTQARSAHLIVKPYQGKVSSLDCKTHTRVRSAQLFLRS
ncbi:hypothetical protein RRG08_014173 [Elysia crispata]|uniref:Uncharacterized protein n=1 Tax=Elysia crispata TaxID=231223 RepID=A0AAE0Z4Y3_9GAST|nr:hypothetical protein RRG08_014173 [Elysia crispata]